MPKGKKKKEIINESLSFLFDIQLHKNNLSPRLRINSQIFIQSLIVTGYIKNKENQYRC